MKSISIFKKFLIISGVLVLTVIWWELYFLASIHREVKKEMASDEIVEKINLLVLNLSGYKNYEGEFKEQWDTQVGSINSILAEHPHLKARIKRDFGKFTKAYEEEFIKKPNNEDSTAPLLFMESNQEYIEAILAQLKIYSEDTTSDLMILRGISSALQILLFVICISLLIYYFHSFHIGYENSMLLLQRALKKMETNEEITSYKQQVGKRIDGELREQINELLTGLHYKIEEKDRELQNNKDLLLLLIKYLPIGLAISSLNDKKIKITNTEFSEIYGFEPKHLDEINSSVVSSNNKKTGYNRVLPENDSHPPNIPVNYKNQIVVDKNGIPKNIEIQRIPVPNQDLLISIVTNNTELLKTEKARENTKRFLEVLFETDSLGLSLLDREGCFLRVNQRFCKIYKYTKEELIGKHFSELLPREDKEFFTRAFKDQVSKKSPEGPGMKEYKVVRKDGETRDVLSNSEPFITEELHGTIYSIIDITETKTEKGKMMAAIEGGSLGAWNIDFDYGTKEVNEEWATMLGYNKFEIPSTIKFFESLIHPQDLSSFKRSVDSVLTGSQGSFSLELRLRCKNGQYKWILDSGKVIKRDSQGRVLLMAGSHVDIDKVKRKELELLSTGERLRRAQEMGMVGDWELDLATGNLACSSMVYRIFGRRKDNSILSLDDITGQFHHNSSKKFKNAIERLTSDKSSISMDGDVFLPDGKIKYLRIIAVPILGEDREVTRVLGIFQDITSIKVAQERFETANKRLQLLSDNIPGGLIQFRVNGNLPPQILYLSKAAENIWNLSREEAFLGNGEHLFKNIHPQDHNYIKRSLQVATKKLTRLSLHWRTISNNGALKWHHGIGIPTKNPDSTVTWNALVLDVTEKKIAENKLREQEEYMQVLTRHASDGIIACDLEGKVQFVNQTLKDWAGPQEEDVAPKNWPQKYHLYSIDGDRHLKVSELSLFRALETGKVYKQEFLIKRPGTPVRYVQSNGSALKDATGNRIGAMVMLRDITQKVQQEVEVSNATIRAREKERTKIASEIHDGITQSLSVVAMNMKNLRYDYKELNKSDSYKKALDYLNEVIDQSRSLAHTIMPNSIKDFGLIEAVQELVEQSCSGSKKEISFEHTEYRRIASSKELHIFRVIQEGLGNAIKHSEGTKIKIRLFFEDDHIKGSLEDNGKGFDVKKSYLKQGIGLISMRDRVKKLSGKFRVYSRKGTVIWFQVPVKYKKETNEEANTHFYSR